MHNEKDYNISGINLSEIRNYYEVHVIKQMKKLLPEFPDFDQCQLCIEDVYALSLSRIPSVYAQNGSIILHKELTDEDVADIVKYAIYQVIGRPRHN
ncbi:MAG: late competence development ComFB family protein [Deltaproteobacteria bacterium]|nr:late competence development ComFB family protein [Deltaproteobacteria bacterium]